MDWVSTQGSQSVERLPTYLSPGPVSPPPDAILTNALRFDTWHECVRMQGHQIPRLESGDLIDKTSFASGSSS